MDGHGPTRRQNEPRQYASSGDRFASLQDSGRSFSDELAGRRRQPVPVTGSGSSSQRNALANYSFYAAQEPSFTAVSSVDQMTYQTDYAQEPRQQQANFAAYDSNLTYGMNQQPLGGLMYESSQQFNQQQSAAGQVLSNANPFYSSESMATQVHSGIYTGPVNSIGLPQTRQEGTAGPETSATIDHGYRRCSADLGQIFQNISDGTLAVASQLLSSFSEWLISHVEDMELTVDDSAQEEIRSKLWDDFNNAWLALMHKQMSLTKGLLEAGITLQQPQLMTAEVISKMCSDLIKLNDDYLEKHGLVNYQYGVLEDQIIESAIICLDILENYGSQQQGQQMLSIRGQASTSRPG
ncbi:hypothetical protein V502_09838 [Pseudogymnoascus sp. VKM F-4520 (FW-2644)]|nr:hypothetical protein V502_09838 [Pseudogymnoascus sp. VKM F-4520 (FW-2644)]